MARIPSVRAHRLTNSLSESTQTDTGVYPLITPLLWRARILAPLRDPLCSTVHPLMTLLLRRARVLAPHRDPEAARALLDPNRRADGRYQRARAGRGSARRVGQSGCCLGYRRGTAAAAAAGTTAAPAPRTGTGSPGAASASLLAPPRRRHHPRRRRRRPRALSLAPPSRTWTLCVSSNFPGRRRRSSSRYLDWISILR